MAARRWLLVASTLAAAVSFASPAAAAPSQPLEYVNLGDSFSAGAGVFPVATTQALPCMQSEQNFSHLIAQQRGYRLTDVSCGGAKTENFYVPHYPGTRPQLEALTPATELVTLMIGGNDNNTFMGAIASCVAATVAHPGAPDPCRAQYGASLTEPIEARTYPALVKALGDIHDKSPRAQVIIAGYPWLVPASGSCQPQWPIAPGDVEYIRDLEAKVNDAVRRAAEATDTTFVDMAQVSEGRDGCQSVEQRWVEPLLNTAQPAPAHPNAEGERALATEILKAIGKG
ncbi:SGNH/GDSL hydrolase family protein [Rhodococcus oryzae]|uniref:SGNH/GDSL hydrolase family protein n=2 Tax=Rhodococcus oryzae TaxID=2571143 RepID=A0ABY2RLN6_9NOCA|nr:SGNH/GDSL hydrolase family protein [Rhodococcus oryzae]